MMETMIIQTMAVSEKDRRKTDNDKLRVRVAIILIVTLTEQWQ